MTLKEVIKLRIMFLHVLGLKCFPLKFFDVLMFSVKVWYLFYNVYSKNSLFFISIIKCTLLKFSVCC